MPTEYSQEILNRFIPEINHTPGAGHPEHKDEFTRYGGSMILSGVINDNGEVFDFFNKSHHVDNSGQSFIYDLIEISGMSGVDWDTNYVTWPTIYGSRVEEYAEVGDNTTYFLNSNQIIDLSTVDPYGIFSAASDIGTHIDNNDDNCFYCTDSDEIIDAMDHGRMFRFCILLHMYYYDYFMPHPDWWDAYSPYFGDTLESELMPDRRGDRCDRLWYQAVYSSVTNGSRQWDPDSAYTYQGGTSYHYITDYPEGYSQGHVLYHPYQTYKVPGLVFECFKQCPSSSHYTIRSLNEFDDHNEYMVSGEDMDLILRGVHYGMRHFVDACVYNFGNSTITNLLSYLVDLDYPNNPAYPGAHWFRTQKCIRNTQGDPLSDRSVAFGIQYDSQDTDANMTKYYLENISTVEIDNVTYPTGSLDANGDPIEAYNFPVFVTSLEDRSFDDEVFIDDLSGSEELEIVKYWSDDSCRGVRPPFIDIDLYILEDGVEKYLETLTMTEEEDRVNETTWRHVFPVYRYKDGNPISYVVREHSIETDKRKYTGEVYFDNFDSYTTSTTDVTGVEPPGWEVKRIYSESTNPFLPSIFYASGYAHSGNYSLYFRSQCIYAMPRLDADINNLIMHLWVRQPYTWCWLEVGVWEDDNNFVVVDTITSPNDRVSYTSVDFSSYTGPGGRIAFHNLPDPSYSTDPNANNWSYIDDVRISLNDVKINSLPYYENFSGYTTIIPSGSVGRTDIEPAGWDIISYQGYNYVTKDYRPQLCVMSNISEHPNGPGGYYLYMQQQCVYAMPRLADNINIRSLKMTINLYQYNGSTNILNVGVIEEDNTFTIVQTIQNAQLSKFLWTDVDFSGYTGTGNRIALQNTRTDSTSSNTFNIIAEISLVENTTPSQNVKISLPYFENFQNYTTSTSTYTGVEPTGWEMVETYMSSGYDPQIRYGNTTSHSQPYGLLMAKRCLYAMPKLNPDIRLNRLVMDFYIRYDSTSVALQVGVWESNNTFTPIKTFYSNGTSSMVYTYIDFSSYTGTGKQIAFKNIRTDGSSSTAYLYIDDIRLRVNPNMGVYDISYESPYSGSFVGGNVNWGGKELTGYNTTITNNTDLISIWGLGDIRRDINVIKKWEGFESCDANDACHCRAEASGTLNANGTKYSWQSTHHPIDYITIPNVPLLNIRSTDFIQESVGDWHAVITHSDNFLEWTVVNICEKYDGHPIDDSEIGNIFFFEVDPECINLAADQNVRGFGVSGNWRGMSGRPLVYKIRYYPDSFIGYDPGTPEYYEWLYKGWTPYLPGNNAVDSDGYLTTGSEYDDIPLLKYSGEDIIVPYNANFAKNSNMKVRIYIGAERVHRDRLGTFVLSTYHGTGAQTYALYAINTEYPYNGSHGIPIRCGGYINSLYGLSVSGESELYNDVNDITDGDVRLGIWDNWVETQWHIANIRVNGTEKYSKQYVFSNKKASDDNTARVDDWIHSRRLFRLSGLGYGEGYVNGEPERWALGGIQNSEVKVWYNSNVPYNNDGGVVKGGMYARLFEGNHNLVDASQLIIPLPYCDLMYFKTFADTGLLSGNTTQTAYISSKIAAQHHHPQWAIAAGEIEKPLCHVFGALKGMYSDCKRIAVLYNVAFHSDHILKGGLVIGMHYFDSMFSGVTGLGRTEDWDINYEQYTTSLGESFPWGACMNMFARTYGCSYNIVDTSGNTQMTNPNPFGDTVICQVVTGGHWFGPRMIRNAQTVGGHAFRGMFESSSACYYFYVNDGPVYPPGAFFVNERFPELRNIPAFVYANMFNSNIAEMPRGNSTTANQGGIGHYVKVGPATTLNPNTDGVGYIGKGAFWGMFKNSNIRSCIVGSTEKIYQSSAEIYSVSNYDKWSFGYMFDGCFKLGYIGGFIKTWTGHEIAHKNWVRGVVKDKRCVFRRWNDDRDVFNCNWPITQPRCDDRIPKKWSVVRGVGEGHTEQNGWDPIGNQSVGWQHGYVPDT